LLLALAEELKLPLLQIARQAELGQGGNASDLANIETAATRALWFIDSYLLSHQLHNGQLPLQLEPVAVSGVLHDVAHSLSGLAKQYGCNLELEIAGRYPPVMAHRQGLHAALTGLGVTLITAAGTGKTRVTLAAHSAQGGTVAGVFTEQTGLSQAAFRQGKSLYGRANQALREATAQPGAGVFIADSLFDAMAAQLRVASHRKLTGLAATLPASHQLSLV
jgi:hypothetical protein